MGRLNLTLPDDTLATLDRYARESGQQLASAARGLLQEALARREAAARRRQLAADYAADRSDVARLLQDLEPSQLELDDEAR